MTDEWFDIVWINFTKAILHGRFNDADLEMTLTDEQREQVGAINERHDAELKQLLRGIATGAA